MDRHEGRDGQRLGRVRRTELANYNGSTSEEGGDERGTHD